MIQGQFLTRVQLISESLKCKNYRGITLTTRVAKIYNALPLNLIPSEVKKVFRGIKTVFKEIDPQLPRS